MRRKIFTYSQTNRDGLCHGSPRFANRGGGPRGSWFGLPRNRTVRWLGGSRFAKTRTEPWRFGAVRANRRGLWNRGQHYSGDIRP